MGMVGARRVLAGAMAVSAGAFGAVAPGALGADAPGPAYVDELASQLQPLRDAGPGDRAEARDSGLTLERGAVKVDVYVDGNASDAAQRLRDAGMDVAVTAQQPRPVVEGTLPLDAIAEVAELGVSEAVIPVMGYGTDAGGTDVGALTSEGVVKHNFPAAIVAAGNNGTGVDVGVISDSMNQVGGGIAASRATGDLPANTTTILDEAGGSDEGRAMAEIIYDEAPGLNSITFSSGTALGAVGKAQSIDNLTARGVDLIADDIFYLSEPFFQDGVVAQAVDRSKAAGVAYLASAGNRGRQSYESDYRDAAGLHDFDAGAGTDTRNCFSGTVPAPTGANPNPFILVALGWDEPVGNVTTDLDIRITNPAGVTLGSPGVSDNVATGDPKEFASFTNAGAAVQPCVEIARSAGTASPHIKWIEQDNYAPTPVPEINTASDTINPDAASAQGSLAVAAVDQADPGLDTPESFSSRGPKTRYFDAQGNRLATPQVLAKPQLAAADGVATTVPGFNPPDNFFGTSAATPSAAGIATLLRATNPDATVNEIYRVMSDPANAIQCATSTPTEDCGAGFLLADRAVNALDRNGAVVRAKTKPAKPDGKGGWFTKTVTVRWNVSDPDSPIESTDKCDKTKIKKDGKRKLTCSALSGGGPGSATIKIKRDAKPPSKPKIKGIEKNRTYRAGHVPKKVKCKAKDKTSGLRSCKIKGIKQGRGKHKIKAVATDFAGNKSKKSIKYRVK